MQFTYTFLPLLWFGYQVVTDATIKVQSRQRKQGENRQLEGVVALEEGESISVRSLMFAELTSATGALQRTMVLENVQSNAWLGKPCDSLHGNVGRRFSDQVDVCKCWCGNSVWMYCTRVMCT